MELNREQIIRALEFCAEHEYCVSCPCDNECIGMESLMLDTLSLIKELTEENERLREHNITLEQKLMLLGIDDVYVFKAKVKGE